MNNLASHKITKDIVSKYGFRFTKSLGQNFLVDEHVLSQIVDSAEIDSEDTVIEIGPGIGTLTRELSYRAKQVISIEIDKNLIPILSETLADRDNIKIINVENEYELINLSERAEEVLIFSINDYKKYAKPIDRFLAKTDKENHPEAKQRYRMEFIELQNNHI